MSTHHGLARTVAGVVMTCLCTAAWAGGSATWSGGGQSMRIDWQDTDTVRMGTSGDDYMLVRDGNAYMVSNRGGQPMVIDWAAMRSMMGGGNAGPQAQGPVGDDTLVSMEATGRSETVAGIEGEVYRVTYRDDSGQGTQEVVLSDHPLAVEMTQAWFATMQAMVGRSGGEGSMDAELAERGLGLLRAGDDFRVTQVSDDGRPDGDFELPAEPQAMPGMGR